LGGGLPRRSRRERKIRVVVKQKMHPTQYVLGWRRRGTTYGEERNKPGGANELYKPFGYEEPDQPRVSGRKDVFIRSKGGAAG